MSLPPMQLHMFMPSAEALQPVTAKPARGYRLRTYQSGDEADILEVLELAGFDGWRVPQFTDYMQAPERTDGTHVATFAGLIVAIAFASQETPVPPIGRLDHVAADPKHRGRGLGLALCHAVARYLFDRGYTSIVLSTDDWRLPAIKTYLKLGFRPKVIRGDMPDRWRTVLDKLDWPCDSKWLNYSPARA